MKNSIRCCIACILPCGALDVIRIVHSNGYVEEISGSNIKASDIMKAHPKHVLKKPSSPNSHHQYDVDDHAAAAALPKIVIVPPEAQLQRGKIYFLMPLPSNPEKTSHTRSRSSSIRRKKQRDHQIRQRSNGLLNHDSNAAVSINSNSSFVISDQYLSEILSEKASTPREGRRGRVGVWRPHLESICESPIEV